MYLQDLIGGKEEVILAAMQNPGLAPKRRPNIEQALKAVAGEVEYRVKMRVANDVLPKLQDAYDMYVLMNGEYEDVGEVDGQDADEDFIKASQDEYGSGLDDEVEKLLEPFETHLSADWLGRNTIDTQLWAEGAIQRLAESVGKEVFKQLSYNKTPAQVLSNAGIVSADVEIYFEQHMNQTQEKPMSDGNETLTEIAAKIKQHVGEGFDVSEVYSDIELVCEDDEILAAGALARLGLETEDYNVVQMATLDHGDDTAEHLYNLVNEATASKPKAAKPAKPKKEATPAKVENAVDPRVLQLLKDHSAVKDTDMSARLGVSRATYNNWLNAKNAFVPDGDQYHTLREQIVEDVNGLLEALAALDGTEQMAVS